VRREDYADHIFVPAIIVPVIIVPAIIVPAIIQSLIEGGVSATSFETAHDFCENKYVGALFGLSVAFDSWTQCSRRAFMFPRHLFRLDRNVSHAPKNKRFLHSANLRYGRDDRIGRSEHPLVELRNFGEILNRKKDQQLSRLGLDAAGVEHHGPLPEMRKVVAHLEVLHPSIAGQDLLQ